MTVPLKDDSEVVDDSPDDSNSTDPGDNDTSEAASASFEFVLLGLVAVIR